MTAENCKIEYLGFEPDYSQLSEIRHLVESIYVQAPHDCFLKLTISYKSDGYSAYLDINSPVEKFLVDAHDRSLRMTMSVLRNRSLEKINAWKKRRFQKPSADLAG